MVSPLSLCVFAAVPLLLAVAVGWLRRVDVGDALADASGALVGTSLFLALSVVLLAASQRLSASEFWRDAGSIALLACPLGASIGLRYRGRRSLPRALLGSAIAVAGVVLWLTLNLQGPRGGWAAAEIAIVLPAAAVAVASAACVGWWSKRAIRN
jgi:hypothetical protein